MEKLNLQSILKTKAFGKKRVEQLIEIKGAIFSLIKDGHQFDDDVLAAAHISCHAGESIVHTSLREINMKPLEKLKKDTKSAKQIISEMNNAIFDGDDEKYDEVEDNTYDEEVE